MRPEDEAEVDAGVEATLRALGRGRLAALARGPRPGAALLCVSCHDEVARGEALDCTVCRRPYHAECAASRGRCAEPRCSGVTTEARETPRAVPTPRSVMTDAEFSATLKDLSVRVTVADVMTDSLARRIAAQARPRGAARGRGRFRHG